MGAGKIREKISKFLEFFRIKTDPRRVRIERAYVTDRHGNTINFIRIGLNRFHVMGPNLNYKILDKHKDGTIKLLGREGGPSLISTKSEEEVRPLYSLLLKNGNFAGLGSISSQWQNLYISKIEMNKYGGVSFECRATDEENIIKNLKWVSVDEKSISNHS